MSTLPGGQHMSGRMEGKVVFVTGAARGQGRSHALRLAEEGADIIAVDLCAQIASNPYPLSTPEDLAQTAEAIEALDRRVVARQGDVRDRVRLQAVVEEGIAELGHLDAVVANAGILPMGNEDGRSAFVDAVDVDYVGVINSVAVALPHLTSGSSIVVTGSTGALIPKTVDNPTLGSGGSGYGFAKRQLVAYVEALALQVARYMIRVNAVHPTNCNTDLLNNQWMYNIFRPDLDSPTRDDVEAAFVAFQAMPIPYVEPIDISNLVLFLLSDESRYVTGQQICVDAGSLLKWPNGPK
jgi:SDR family mycofactocin-dependent oxidoreductase